MIRSSLVALYLIGGIAVAWAAPIDDKEKADLQAVVSQQIDAFNRADGAAAVALAAPAIKDKFVDATTFLAMVEKGYAPLLHARRFDFGAVTDTPAGPAQAVSIVASDGGLWRGLYTFERVGDAWRISGCVLVQDDSTAI